LNQTGKGKGRRKREINGMVLTTKIKKRGAEQKSTGIWGSGWEATSRRTVPNFLGGGGGRRGLKGPRKFRGWTKAGANGLGRGTASDKSKLA